MNLTMSEYKIDNELAISHIETFGVLCIHEESVSKFSLGDKFWHFHEGHHEDSFINLREKIVEPLLPLEIGTTDKRISDNEQL